VRQSIAAARRGEGLTTAVRAGAWSTLPEAELQPRLEAAEARQRALALQMSSAQWEVEERWVWWLWRHAAQNFTCIHLVPGRTLTARNDKFSQHTSATPFLQ
jgi:hypothetical protein